MEGHTPNIWVACNGPKFGTKIENVNLFELRAGVVAKRSSGRGHEYDQNMFHGILKKQ